MTTRRIYILPTRGGLAFAALVFVMLIAGLNYGNSIALLITFLLAGFGLIAMHLCHRNLAGTVVRSVATRDAFVGEHGGLSVTLGNTADTPRIGLEVSLDDTDEAHASVPRDGTARAELAVPLGIVELVCTIIYLVPRTAILGAILLTGYLGGATATHVRAGDPAAQFLTPVVFGALLWLGLYLRCARLRALIPFRS